MSAEEERQAALNSYRAKLIESREWEAKLKNLRLEIKDMQREFDRTEDNIKALQSVGQIIGEVLKQLDDERFIVKASSGPRYVVGCRSKVDKVKLKQGTRVALDMTTLTIMRMLPREVDPLVYNMSLEDPGQVSFAGIGGLNDQIRELREVIELPLKNPELFLRVGIKPPKGVLLYGPPGTGKTLLARAVASSLETNFLKVVSSAIVDKYIGESARLIREMFGYAKEHEPCIIFMDEIDAIGGRRFSEGTSADREIQRTLMELLNQLDGFDYLGKTKIIMATNRPDTLDPALLRAGRLDRKIEIPLPNEVGRLEILKIHSQSVVVDGDIDFESVVKMSDGLNGADLRNVVTEAGLFAIKDYRESINQDDFNKAVRKVAEAKKLEGKLEYQKLRSNAAGSSWLGADIHSILYLMTGVGWAELDGSLNGDTSDGQSRLVASSGQCQPAWKSGKATQEALWDASLSRAMTSGWGSRAIGAVKQQTRTHDLGTIWRHVHCRPSSTARRPDDGFWWRQHPWGSLGCLGSLASDVAVLGEPIEWMARDEARCTTLERMEMETIQGHACWAAGDLPMPVPKTKQESGTSETLRGPSLEKYEGE
ncbi:hypothetical protein NM208_g13004 [Fusarium decemcellulare]|uniref:Uncharacterized protein n=1 Tax=Fusarium decemcellulare TaxID=57161 RepID=A0ACC1RMU9_9HYPO|nr:hypothetical protein NM208_g13004 [Fusarium decemcellulare]